MSNPGTLSDRYSALVLSLSSAMEANNDTAFGATLDQIMQLREKKLFFELRRLTSDLQGALERFRIDSRLIDMTERDVPDAISRLDHVLKLTSEAAHKTMDLVEQSAPIAERTSTAAAALAILWKRFRDGEIASRDFKQLLEDMDHFLEITQSGTELIRKNMFDVLLTQGYQDLTGQIIRGVMKLVTELEVALSQLILISATGAPELQKATTVPRVGGGYGPAVPGVDHGDVVDGQDDVDSLLSGLGL